MATLKVIKELSDLVGAQEEAVNGKVSLGYELDLETGIVKFYSGDKQLTGTVQHKSLPLKGYETARLERYRFRFVVREEVAKEDGTVEPREVIEYTIEDYLPIPTSRLIRRAAYGLTKNHRALQQSLKKDKQVSSAEQRRREGEAYKAKLKEELKRLADGDKPEVIEDESPLQEPIIQEDFTIAA